VSAVLVGTHYLSPVLAAELLMHEVTAGSSNRRQTCAAIAPICSIES
jgi:hypothetical protein